MPLTYHLNLDRRRIDTVATGVLTDADLVGYKTAILADDRIGPGWVEVADGRGIERLGVTADGVRILGQMDMAHTTNRPPSPVDEFVLKFQKPM